MEQPLVTAPPETVPFSLPVPSAPTFGGETHLMQALPALVDSFVRIAYLAAGALAIFYILYAGILYITAGGNAEQVKKARATLTNVIIGVIILETVFALIRFAVSIGATVGGLN